MRKPSRSDGFFLCFVLNLFWRSGWGALALLLWLLRLRLAVIPWYAPLIPLGAWLLSALAYTVFLSFVSRAGGRPAPQQENKNPYSARNEDYFPVRNETFTVDEWMGHIQYLWDAVSLLGVPIEQFVDFANRAQAAEEPPGERISIFFGELYKAGLLAPEGDCREFRICLGGASGYVGAVPVENAEAFETKLRYYFLQMDCGYGIMLP